MEPQGAQGPTLQKYMFWRGVTWEPQGSLDPLEVAPLERASGLALFEGAKETAPGAKPTKTKKQQKTTKKPKGQKIVKKKFAS